MTLLVPERRAALRTSEQIQGLDEPEEPTRPGRRFRPGPRLPPASLAHRVIVAVAAIGLLGPAFATWAGIVSAHLTGVASVLITAGSLAILVGALTVKTERALCRIEVVLVVLGVLTLAAWAASVVVANPAYGTDEAAFEQYAAKLLLGGVNPYAHNLLPALLRYRVPIQYATYTTSGGVVSTLGYPALPVLLVVPFMWLTGGVQAVPVLNIVALATTMVITFCVLPRQYRSLAVVTVVGLPILFGYGVAGVNVILALPFLCLVAWRFTETGSGGRLGRRGVAQAIALGLAVSVQQTAWFIFPFVVVAIWAARRTELGRRATAVVVGRYVAISLGIFLGVNAGFIASGPSVWAKGVLEPLVQHAIPYGQGLIDVPVFAGIGGGSLGFYTFGAVVVLLGLLVCFRLFFHRLWRCAFILPSIALFFPTRSLAEYWMTLISVWLVSMFAAPPAPGGEIKVPRPLRRISWWRGGLAGLSLLPGLGLLGIAVGSQSPLVIDVVGIHTNGQFQRVWELIVNVTNRSGSELEPHFATNSIGQMTPFWHRMAGPETLAAGRTARYVLAAPTVGAMPGITQPFQIDAVTNKPETISVTGNITTEPYSAWIYQSEVDRVLRPGQGTRLTVQLRSPLGSVVNKAGVKVELGQVVYGQSQLTLGEARINGAPQGRSPVTMTTNARGEATFHIADSSPQGQPVYFQAWTDSKAGYPFGYSEIVDVLWAGHGG